MDKERVIFEPVSPKIMLNSYSLKKGGETE